MNTPLPITIRPFQPSDQIAAKQLILTGMAEYWGTINETLNPDLNNIAHSYAHATFLVAEQNGKIAGTGALIPKPDKVGEVVRMSVAPDCRRAGIGTLLLQALCRAGEKKGYNKIVLETNADWQKAVAFYERFGFCKTHVIDGKFGSEVHFEWIIKGDMGNK